MAKKSILLSGELTSALATVSQKKLETGVTAGHSDLSQSTREALQAAYYDLKAIMTDFGQKLDVAPHNIKPSMGRYQASGRYFPHIWGAYIPEEAVRCSRVTTQLYVFRKETSISWGICPSDAALEDEEFMEAFRAVLVANKEMVTNLFSNGFRGRIGIGRDKQTIEAPGEFLASKDLTLSRIYKISELSDETFESVLFNDLKKLLPLYRSIVESLRTKNFWVDAAPSEEAEKRYWLVAAGASGEMWDAFKSESMIAISYKELKKSFLEYSSREEIESALKAVYSDDRGRTHTSLACFEFARVVKPGDFIFAKAGKTKLLAFGQILSDYIYDKSRTDYQHLRKVKWISIGPWGMPDGENLVTKTLTDISDYEGYPEHLKEIAGLTNGADTIQNTEPVRDESRSPLDLEKLTAITGKSADFLQSIARRLEEKKQIIFYGPPGTGKTFVANAFADWFQGVTGLRDQIQFHPSYSYEDFIEGFRPSADSEKSGFSLKPGIFKQFCERAASAPGKHVFVIDELNRGNLAHVFGELLYALEYRGKNVGLPYSGRKFAVPPNVYVIGTMNSADRSIAIIDFAIRRRFDFFEFSPDEFVLKRYLESIDCKSDVAKVISSFKKLNELIHERRGKQYEIGHSFWMKKHITDQVLRDIWEFNIRPLLEEYFFDEPAMVQRLAEEAWGYLGLVKVAA